VTLSHWQALSGFKEMKTNKASEGDKVTEINFEPVIPRTETRLNDVSDNFPSEGQQEDSQEISRDEQNDVGDDTVSHTQQPVSESDNIRRTRTRVIRRPERLIKVGYSSYYEVLHEDDYKLQDEMTDPIAFLSHHSDPDTMYLHEAMRQPDREDFIKAMIILIGGIGY
jgi:hypothetical protein